MSLIKTWKWILSQNRQVLFKQNTFNVYGYFKNSVHTSETKGWLFIIQEWDGSYHRRFFMISSLTSCLWRQGKPQNIINGAINIKQKTCLYQMCTVWLPKLKKKYSWNNTSCSRRERKFEMCGKIKSLRVF